MSDTFLLDVTESADHCVFESSMNRRRAPRRIYHSQRRGAQSEGGWRQRNEEQGQGKAQVREVEESREQQGKETVPRGTCQTMCPARELRDREAQNRLHRFEMLAGTERDRLPKGDPLRAVKEYSRPAAGKDSTNPTHLRPPAVLLKAVCYLIDDIAASTDLHPWTEVYSFVFDRLRGVKQDMIIQRVSGVDCVAILERTVRFLIYSSYQLCGEPLRLYDPRINDMHLQENLSWLLDCYKTGTGLNPNQEEFQALGLLYNLGSARVAQHIMELPERLRSSPAISLALSINQAFLERNPVRLLRLSQRLNFLQSCALHRHLVTCRRDLLLIYSHGHSSRNCRFPLDRMAQLLSLETSLTNQLCQVYGVEVNQDSHVVFSKTTFTEPEQGKLHCKLYHNIVAEKQSDLTIGRIIHGCS
ncbi:SAC3 domain-containing protein 1 [Labrus mixtus]|uniref:SAC3 domain-containing protein 1 n=1 Tax=Labrus mixtus TaxID=508554 RepID=UPI0029C03345|nr:SAC3 domain-containing protein 1 [Labrus mixtus]